MPELSDNPMILAPGPEPETLETITVSERRAELRFLFTAAADILELQSQTRIKCRTSDLGYGGCYIDTPVSFAVNSVVRVRLEHDLKEFEATAVVVYASAPMGMGLAFTEIPEEHQPVLKGWVAKLNGGHSLEPETIATGPEGGILAAVENLRTILKEMIYLMIRKNLISENEGAGLMRKMFR